jgi:hypothetical protein
MPKDAVGSGSPLQARARRQLKEVLGKIKLHPRDGYLEAELCGSFRGFMSLTSEQDAQTKKIWLRGRASNVICT